MYYKTTDNSVSYDAITDYVFHEVQPLTHTGFDEENKLQNLFVFVMISWNKINYLIINSMLFILYH